MKEKLNDGMARLLPWVFLLAMAPLPLPAQIDWARSVSWVGPNPLDRDDAKRGRALFTQSCAFCHGKNADGGAEGPNLIRSSLVRHDREGNQIGPVIRDGRPERGMPAVRLAPDQISDVVAFLHAIVSIADSIGDEGPARNYSLKLLLTGNAERGKAFFNGKGRCTECHSPARDLKGLATRFPPIELQARFLYPETERKRPRATVTLASGEQQSGELAHLDSFSVALIDRDGWYHSWPLTQAKVKVEDRLEAHRRLLGEYSSGDVHDVFAYLETMK